MNTAIIRRFADQVSKDTRAIVLLGLSVAMGVASAIEEARAHNYVLVLAALFFWWVAFPWLSWNYIKPRK